MNFIITFDGRFVVSSIMVNSPIEWISIRNMTSHLDAQSFDEDSASWCLHVSNVTELPCEVIDEEQLFKLRANENN